MRRVLENIKEKPKYVCSFVCKNKKPVINYLFITGYENKGSV